MSASTTDAMYQVPLLQGYPDALRRGSRVLHATGIIQVATDIMSETYYAGEKGDEVSDFSLNFKLGNT